jgi:hypothetical protein
VRYASWTDDQLDYENPVLCDVCELLLMAPDEAIDAWDEIDQLSALKTFEQELARRWRERAE